MTHYFSNSSNPSVVWTEARCGGWCALLVSNACCPARLGTPTSCCTGDSSLVMAAPSSPGTSRTVRDDLGYEEVAAIGAVSLALARYEGFPAHANAIEHVMNQVHASP
jgi:hypothetical protein